MGTVEQDLYRYEREQDVEFAFNYQFEQAVVEALADPKTILDLDGCMEYWQFMAIAKLDAAGDYVEAGYVREKFRRDELQKSCANDDEVRHYISSSNSRLVKYVPSWHCEKNIFRDALARFWAAFKREYFA